MTEQKCDHCGGPATHEGWAFPAGGSFPVTGCVSCLGDLAESMDLQVFRIDMEEASDG